MSGQQNRPECEPELADQTSEQQPEDTAREAEATPGEADAEATIASLQALADENWDKFLRASAELENVRKRASRDVEKAHRYALERFCSELLAVRDSLEMGVAAADNADAQSLLEGKEATLKLLKATMERFGVVELNPEGEPFNPEEHEAMTMQPSADAEPGSVLTVFQKGYALNGRLLRPARVVVAADPAETPDDAES